MWEFSKYENMGIWKIGKYGILGIRELWRFAKV